MSAAALSKAGQAEILRASQKDQFFVSHLVQVRIFVLMNKRFNLSIPKNMRRLLKININHLIHIVRRLQI